MPGGCHRCWGAAAACACTHRGLPLARLAGGMQSGSYHKIAGAGSPALEALAIKAVQATIRDQMP